MSRGPTCVFVGNIPYDATEQQLKDLFAQVGPVVSFRLVKDRDTGMPKGYGFCEYKDVDIANSALRNLNNVELNGRQLKVDFAEGDAKGGPAGGERTGAAHAQPPTDANPTSHIEAVEKVLGGLSPDQLRDILWNMKQLAGQNPDQVRQMLLAHPQLSFALIQAQVILGLVDPAAVKAILAQQPRHVAQPPMGGMPGRGPEPMPGRPDAYGAPGFGGAPPGAGGPPRPHGGAPPPGGVPRPNLPPLEEQHQALLQQVMNMTPAQIDRLPEAQRQKVQQVRQALGLR